MLPEVAKLAGNKQNVFFAPVAKRVNIVSESKWATHVFDDKLTSEEVWGKMFTLSRPQDYTQCM